MQSSSGEGRAGVFGGHADPGESVGRVAFLDQALWKHFRDAETREAFARYWLALQCRMLEGARRGVVKLCGASSSGFDVVVHWPEDDVGTSSLEAAAEMALAERRGVVRGRQKAGEAETFGDCDVAYPLLFADQVSGIVAIEMTGRSPTELRGIMRALQWGAAWIEVYLKRDENEAQQHKHARTVTALDAVAVAIAHDGFRAACKAVATELATRLDWERVSVGFLSQGHCRVAALSHSAQFDKRMNLIRSIGAAMDEAIDQRSVVVHPAEEEGEYLVTRAHRDLSRGHGSGSIVTIPITVKDRSLGAITFERPDRQPIAPQTIELCECVASVVGPILDQMRRNDRLLIVKAWDASAEQLKRLIGPLYVGRKMAAVLSTMVVAGLVLVHDDYRVTAPSRLEGLVQRVIVAPFDGYVLSERKRAGDTVRRSEVLAALDEKDLALEHLRWTATRLQHLRQYDRALAERNRAEAGIVKAQIAQTAAQIALFAEQLARAKLVSPFDGLVVSGDLSQSVGAPVKRGDVLFEIAPLDAYRVILEVDETDVAEVAVGQTGSLLLSSLPGQPLRFAVTKLTPVAEARDGRNAFRIEAQLADGSERLRPGMEGIAKIEIDRRRLIWIWTHKLVDWLRLSTWSWWP